jgi:hypothetical protein
MGWSAAAREYRGGLDVYMIGLHPGVSRWMGRIGCIYIYISPYGLLGITFTCRYDLFVMFSDHESKRYPRIDIRFVEDAWRC